MIRFIQFICLTIVISQLIACGNKEKSEKQERIARYKLKKELFEKRLEDFNLKHEPYFNWDTLDMKYSFMYRNVLLSKKQIIINPTIRDIVWQDSFYILSILVGSYPIYYFDLKTSDNQLITDITNTSKFKLILLVDTDYISRLRPQSIFDDDYYSTTYLEYDFDDYYVKGKILSYDIFDNN